MEAHYKMIQDVVANDIRWKGECVSAMSRSVELECAGVRLLKHAFALCLCQQQSPLGPA